MKKKIKRLLLLFICFSLAFPFVVKADNIEGDFGPVADTPTGEAVRDNYKKENGWKCEDGKCTDKEGNTKDEDKLDEEINDKYNLNGEKDSSSDKDDTEKEIRDKPQFNMQLNQANGCVIMGSNLNNLLGDIYKWIRGAAAALVVILGILDFLRATTSDDAEAMRKAGSTFVKRLILLAILIMLPYLIDFVLELLFGSSLETCLDPFK